MKVVILCGGQGTRLREKTETVPKPMVEIGGMPIVWHIMKNYVRSGFTEFILCLGYKGEVIKNFFYNFDILSNDFTIELGKKDNIQVHRREDEPGWKITLVDTGLNTMTGARVKRIEDFVDGDSFMLTYGDGVTDLDISQLKAFHKDQDKIGVVTGVSPPSRYGELVIEKDRVVSFTEKPTWEKEPERMNTINGGYFVFKRQFFDYLDRDEGCILERAPLEKLAANGQLAVYEHRGFWQCMDTFRDYKYLSDLWNGGNAPWKKW